MIQRGLQSMAPSPLCPPNLRAWGEQAPRRLTAGGVRTRSRLPKKEEGEGLGPSPVAPRTQAMGDGEAGQARICVSCSQGSLPSNSPVPSTPPRAVTQIPGVVAQ